MPAIRQPAINPWISGSALQNMMLPALMPSLTAASKVPGSKSPLTTLSITASATCLKMSSASPPA